MEDNEIIELYWARSQSAIEKTAEKYEKYCYAIAYNILENPEDADESVNDAYLSAWNCIPPHRPAVFSVFLGKLTRRISIDRWRARSAEKRGGGQIVLALDELSDCVPARGNVEQAFDAVELGKAIDTFVMTLSPTERRVFICRYWYLDSIAAISKQFGFSQSKVKVMLHRTRANLRNYLETEGFSQ